MMNEVKYLYIEDPSPTLRMTGKSPTTWILSESFGAVFPAFAKYSFDVDFDDPCER